jgi:hypothetical protein
LSAIPHYELITCTVPAFLGIAAIAVISSPVRLSLLVVLKKILDVAPLRT